MLSKRIIAGILSLGSLLSLTSCNGLTGYRGATNNSEYECASLTEYPSVFNNNGAFTGYFVVGRMANSSDNLSMTDIAVNLDMMVVDATRLDSEIDDASKYDLITVGNPCYNEVTAEVLGSEFGNGELEGSCLDGFVEGEARVLMLKHKETGKLAMVVAGYDGAETRLAAKVIAHRSEELRETGACEVKISGDNYLEASIRIVN